MSFDQFMVDVVNVAREDMVEAGYIELREPEEVDEALSRKGRTLVMINLISECAGGMTRGAAAISIHYDKRPDNLYTVFAAQHREATEKARSYFGDYPPSSPSFAFLKDGDIVPMVERHEIEGYAPMEVINRLQSIFDEHCEEI